MDLLGVFSPGPAGDIEDAMRSSHFGHTGFLGVSYPSSYRGCQGVLVRHSCAGNLPAFEVGRRLGNRWSMAMVFSRTPVGTVDGHHEEPAQFFASQYLSLEHRVDSFGALLSIGGRSGQIGLGPTLHNAQIREAAGPSGVEKAWTTHSKLGFVARARATVPARSWIFLDLRAEYHFTGRVPIGPYTPDLLGEGTPATFPSTSASFNYWFIGIGPGLRF